MSKRQTKPLASKVTAAKKTPARKSPPMKADPKPRGKKVAEPKVPDTREDLVAQIRTAFDEVEAIMAQPRPFHVHLSPYDIAVKKPMAVISGLSDRLHMLLNPKDQPGVEDTNDVIQAEFGAKPGVVPKWTQPGKFIVWVGYVPFLCVWGGVIDRTADVVAVDPKQRWMTPSGSAEVRPAYVMERDQSVADVFRRFLTNKVNERIEEFKSGKRVDKGPWFNLHPLADVALESVRKTLAEPGAEWIEMALKLGPVNAIPLPAHLRAVQVSMFG